MTALLAALVLAAPVRVVTYNMQAGERGLDGLVTTLKDADADIIALEEVDRGTRRSGKVDQPSRLAAALGMKSTFVPHFNYHGGEYGLALLSRWPIVRAERVKVKGSQLSLLDATLKAPGGELRVVVVHFTRANDEVKLLEAQAAYALVKDESRPALVLGDMNTRTGSEVYSLFAASLQDSCEAKAEPTWSSDSPFIRIDYVWASKAFAVDACQTLASTASDHLPVRAVLSLR
jgi:endonuclease/exonuclease/phosphatase family metal-dependent hydrolase